MNKKIVKLQLLACGTFSLALAAEWRYSLFTDSEITAILNHHQQTDFQSEELPTMAENAHSLESYAPIVEKPLFIEGRKPIVETNNVDNVISIDNGQLDDWVLIGIYDKNKRQIALFSKRNEAKKFIKVTIDQLLAGWQIKEIQTDRVVLQQGGQQKSVALRKPRVPQPKSNTPTPPGPRPARFALPSAPGKPIEPAPNDNPENNNGN